MRNFIFSSKSFTVPALHIRNVLPFCGVVVSPRRTPSFADHSFGSPSHPVRSFPLKIGLKSESAAWAAMAASVRATKERKRMGLVLAAGFAGVQRCVFPRWQLVPADYAPRLFSQFLP